jgi:hypothetical protein
VNLPQTRLSEPMPPDKWHHIQQVLADAIECPAGEREALVDARAPTTPGSTKWRPRWRRTTPTEGRPSGAV